ncbi:MAG: DUF3794 domain-containing protein [Eubacterium sp.]|nr:DUF3794 domain-containing protein [Eubacterium sp.]
MEIIKEKIIMNKYPQEILTTALMEGDIIVPDAKPDAAEIAYYNPTGAITEAESGKGKISFKGRLCLSVIYLPKGEEKSPVSLRTDIPLSDFVSADLPEECRILSGDIEVTDSVLTVVNDRKLRYRISISLTFQAVPQIEREIVTDVKDLASESKISRVLKTFSPIDLGEENFKISEDLTLPQDSGEIGEIFDTCFMLCQTETKLSRDKLSISADLALKILYEPEGAKEIDVLEYELPVNGAFEIKGGGENPLCRLNLSVVSSSVTPTEDENGEMRKLSCSFNIRASYIILAEQTLNALTDAYIPDKETSSESTELPLTAFVCRNKNQFPVKEVIELDPSAPPILKICHILCRPVCDKTELFKDKVTAEGMVEAKILYTAKDDSRPVYCYETLLPYRQSVEMKGLNPAASPVVDVDLKLEHLSFSTLDSREVEIKPVLSLCLTAAENYKEEVLTDLDFADMSEETLQAYPLMTLYIVKEGDTLFDIAKSHNAPVSSLIKINGLNSETSLTPFQKLLILKNS